MKIRALFHARLHSIKACKARQGCLLWQRKRRVTSPSNQKNYPRYNAVVNLFSKPRGTCWWIISAGNG